MSFWIYHPLISALVVALLTWGVFYGLEHRKQVPLEIYLSHAHISKQGLQNENSTSEHSLKLGHSGQGRKARVSMPLPTRSILLYLGAIAIGFVIAFFATRSIVIAIPFATVCTGIPVLALEGSKKKHLGNLQKLWPETLDHIISGLNSGLSLAETLISLSMRGPAGFRTFFEKFKSDVNMGLNLSVSLKNLQREFKDPIADQVCTVLIFASQSGSRDTSITLRVLSDYIRSDLATRDEISARHGWVRNSASIASVAPWALLLMLASQPDAVSAYSSTSGAVVLGVGASLTFIAYFWMRKVGSMQQAPRVFGI